MSKSPVYKRIKGNYSEMCRISGWQSNMQLRRSAVIQPGVLEQEFEIYYPEGFKNIAKDKELYHSRPGEWCDRLHGDAEQQAAGEEKARKEEEARKRFMNMGSMGEIDLY